MIILYRLKLSLLLGLGLLSCRPQTPSVSSRTEPLPSEVYVWQRQWSADVMDSVLKSQPWLERYHFLAAEVSFAEGKPTPLVTRISCDANAIMNAGVKVGVVIRIFPSAAQTKWNEDAVPAIKELADSLVQEWPQGGVSEVQIDYDCPESKLADYALLLRGLRQHFEGTGIAVSCTALPTWLKHREFVSLAHLVPDYVLQVHSLHLPDAKTQRGSLVDLQETKAAVAKAVEIGVPFRVALPTYSCVVDFSPNGKVREVYAEDVPKTLPLQSANYLVLDSDAYALSDLVQQWQAHAPALMRSVIWYRLPIARDRLNWSLEVLQKLVQKQSLRRGWGAQVIARSEAGYSEVVLNQSGDAPDDAPAHVTLSWAGSEQAVGDGLRGYQVTRSVPGVMILSASEVSRRARLPPGEKLVIGWLRFESSAPAQVKVEMW